MYEVDKIHDKRVVNGDVEYKVSWKGYSKNHKTWEPKNNLTEYGAIDLVLEYEILKTDEKENIKYVYMGKEERAVKHLMGKYELGGTIPQHLQTYNTEMSEVIKQKLGRKLSSKEVKALKSKGVKIIMTRMNPEHPGFFFCNISS